MNYKRILLKISGEALKGKNEFGYDQEALTKIADIIKEVSKYYEVAVVVGGGNILRGRDINYMKNETADHLGMLATVMNALAIEDALKNIGCDAITLTASEMTNHAKTFDKNSAINYLENHKIVIFGEGTGKPFCSTDTASALRASQINAQVIIKATNVDGVYDSDPDTNINAKKYDKITFDEAIENNLEIMDKQAFDICKENNISIIVLNIDEPTNIIKALNNEPIGTLIH